MCYTRFMEKVNILGVPFCVLTQSEAIQTLYEKLDERSNFVVVTPNPEGVMQARRNVEFDGALLNADMQLADGVGILFASILLGCRLPMRVRGIDTTFGLLDCIEKTDRPSTAFFLGGKPASGGLPSVAEAAAKNMEARYKNLNVVGHSHGYYTESEEKGIEERISEASPDILLVCLGMPKAELFCHRNRKMNVGITLCVGGTIDIMAGSARLAPPFMRKLGLEWLYRLMREPKRFVRMLDLPKFLMVTLGDMLIRKFVKEKK